MKDQELNFQIAALISKFLKGEINSQENEILNAWISENKANKQLWEKLTKSPYYLEKQLGNRRAGQTEILWKNFQSQLQPAAKVYKLTPQNCLKYAAVLIPLLLFSFIGYHYLNQQEERPLTSVQPMVTPMPAIAKVLPGTQQARLILSNGHSLDLGVVGNETISENGDVQILNKKNELSYKQKSSETDRPVDFHIIEIPRGGEYKLVLADGTKVWLNAASSMQFPTHFTGDTRQVYLTGEAYFEVAKDAAHPFIVNTKQTLIKVLGTHFNVKAYPDELQHKTTLAEGLVQVSLPQANENINIQPVFLRPGFQTIVSASTGIRIAEANMNEVLAWKNGFFIFESEPLESIMRMLSRWYKVEVNFTDEELKNYHFTGRLKRQDSIVKILEFIEATANVQIDLKENNILTIKKTNKIMKNIKILSIPLIKHL